MTQRAFRTDGYRADAGLGVAQTPNPTPNPSWGKERGIRSDE